MAEQSESCAFGLRLLHALEGGYLALCLAMGLKSGVLATLLQAQTPLSSSQLAERAACKERYVREWLSSLVACDVVDVDVTGTLYYVSPGRAKVLLENFLAIDTFRICASRLPDVTSFFPLKGPAGMSFLERFSFAEVMDRGSEQAAEWCMEEFLSGVPQLQQQLESGIDVAEFACGSGALLQRLARRFPKSRFHGSDYDAGLVERTRRAMTSAGLDNVEVAAVDLCRVPAALQGRFDWVFVRNAIHDVPDALAGLRGLRRALKEGAFGSFLDINLRSSPVENRGSPQVAYLYVSGLMSCLPATLAQNPRADALGIAMGTDEGKQLVQEAGLTLVDCHPCSLNPIYCLFVFKK